jgi:hypothetical protein
MSKVANKQPSKKLREKIGEVANHIRNCATAVNEALALGKEEGFSDKEIGLMIREQLKQLGYDPRSIRRALPSSIKDLSKVKKGYLAGSHDSDSINVDEDKMSSSEDSNNLDENRQSIVELQDQINTLKEQLAEEQMNKDLYEIELQNQLQTEHDDVRTLILLPDEFPPECSEVLKSPEDVFVVEFKGTVILNISVMTLREAYEQFEESIE